MPTPKPPRTKEQEVADLLKQADDAANHEQLADHSKQIFIRGFLVAALYRARSGYEAHIAGFAMQKRFGISDEEIATYYIGG